MTNEDFDAIVVGAGPAGCAAAFDLAASKKRVAILERRTFPRLKPCGGALTIKALNSLRFSIQPIVRNVATHFIAGRELTRETKFNWTHPIAIMTVREELDCYVLGKTLEVGAELIKVDHIDGISTSEDCVEVETDGKRFRAKFLIGADGANSTVRRLTEGVGNQKFGFAIEGQVSDASARQKSMTFDFGLAPRGYGWVFPRGDHYNVGLYTYDSRFRLLPEQLRSYVRERLGRTEVMNIAGAPIGMWGWDSGLSRPQRRVLLVGDAAGLCEPVLGEGIYYAIKSGQVAATSILEEFNNRSRADMEFHRRMQSMRSELRIARGLATRFYRDLGIGCLALTSPLLRYALMKGYSLGIPLGEIPSKLVTLPFRKVPSSYAKLLAETA